MSIIKSEENAKTSQHMRCSTRESPVCGQQNNLNLPELKRKSRSILHDQERILLSYIQLPSTLASSRNGNLYGLRCDVGLPKCGIYSLVILVLIMMSPTPVTADYYQHYVSTAMKNFSKTACEMEYLTINCPEGTSIDILHAMYGRKVPSSEICPMNSGSGENHSDEDINCEAKAGAECQDRRQCKLMVYHRVFGVDPCPGTSKYLSLEYQCTPKVFEEKKACSDRITRLRCRQDTVIAVYEVEPTVDKRCRRKRNSSVTTCNERDIFDHVSKKCHFKSKCWYSMPKTSCFNNVRIKHTCVPSFLLTSEVPTHGRLQTTTVPETTSLPTTSVAVTTTTEETLSTLQSTVNIRSSVNSYLPASTATVPGEINVVRSPFDSDQPESTTDSALVSSSKVNASLPASASNFTDWLLVAAPDETLRPDDYVVIRNDFPMENATGCVNCTDSYFDSDFVTMLRLFTFLEDNHQDIIIAMLLGIIASLLLTICFLVYHRERAPARKEGKDIDDQVTEETREDNRQNVEERHSFQEVEEQPTEEDEHENMSLLGSILQRSVDSNNTASRPHASPNESYVLANTKQPESDDSRQEPCGPKSIFAKICCNCCCRNPPWQRTRILKRNRGNVYHVRHRYSSSIDEEDLTVELRSPDARTAVDHSVPSPIPALEARINHNERSIVTSPTPSSIATPPNATVLSQSQQNFRPISRDAQRNASVTPDTDARQRIQHTFQSHRRQPETQRSDPALNRYSVRQHYNVQQPLTAPTSPVSRHYPNNARVSNDACILRALPPDSPLPVSMLQGARAKTPQTPKYTPPPNHFFNTHSTQYPAFPDAYEQYDNAPDLSHVPMRKQFPPPRDYSSPYTPNSSPYNNYHPGNFSHFPTSSNYECDQFVEAVQYRHAPSNARAIDLGANARTVDLSHDSAVSRNSWIEIRRSSIYDNSLPRNGDMFDYYQQFLPQDYQMPVAQQLELPGSRNLNHYYP